MCSRDRGVEVHLFGDLLRETLDIPEARKLVLDRVFDEKEYGPLATDHLRTPSTSWPPANSSRCWSAG